MGLDDETKVERGFRGFFLKSQIQNQQSQIERSDSLKPPLQGSIFFTDQPRALP
jgi:hypothetical protein